MPLAGEPQRGFRLPSGGRGDCTKAADANGSNKMSNVQRKWPNKDIIIHIGLYLLLRPTPCPDSGASEASSSVLYLLLRPTPCPDSGASEVSSSVLYLLLWPTPCPDSGASEVSSSVLYLLLRPTPCPDSGASEVSQ